MPFGSRRATDGSFSNCPDFVRDLCVACSRVNIQTKDQASGDEGSPNPVVTRMRRNIASAAKALALLPDAEQRSL